MLLYYISGAQPFSATAVSRDTCLATPKGLKDRLVARGTTVAAAEKGCALLLY